MCVTVCGRFCLNEGGVAGYVNRMKVKYAAKWGVQIAGMIFQTRSSYRGSHQGLTQARTLTHCPRKPVKTTRLAQHHKLKEKMDCHRILYFQ